MSNQAAWIESPKANPLVVKDAEMPKPGPGEVVIKNQAWAINPVDWKMQDYDFFVKEYPAILGTDVAGEIYDVGEGVTDVKKGDRVIGHALSILTQVPRDSAFQLYTAIPSLMVSKIPSSLSYADASVLPLALSTAAAVLFQKEALALPLPSSASNVAQTNKSILVWGGSSSVGACAIQLAVGAGIKVVTVSGKHNIEKMKELGAFAVFDHSSPTVVDDIVSAVKGTEFVGVADCITLPESIKAWAPVYEKIGGRWGGVLPDAKGLPKGIEGTNIVAPTISAKDKYVAEAVWGKYVPDALEKGTLKAKPDPIIIKGGLEKLQEGMDKLKKGVSYAKVVVTL